MSLPTVRLRVLQWLPLLLVLPRPPGLYREHHLVLAVLLVLTALLLLLDFAEKRHAPFLPHWAVVGLLLLGSGYLLGMVNARAPETGWLILTQHVTGLALVVLYARAAVEPGFLDGLLRSLAVVAAIAGGENLLDVLGVTRGSPPDGIMRHANVWAFSFTILLPLVVIGLRQWQGWKRLGVGVGVALLALTLPFSQSAGMLLAWTVAGISEALLVWTASRRMKVMLVSTAGVVVALLIAMMTSLGWVTVESRWELVRGGGAIWVDHPVLGTGPGQFLYQYPDHRPLDDINAPATFIDAAIDHVHVEPLHTTLEAGLVGLAGLLLLLGGTAWVTQRARLRDPSALNRALFLAVLAGGTYALFTLAPSREGMLPVAVLFGISLGRASAVSRRAVTVPRWTTLILALALLVSLPLHVRRVAADHAYTVGRDWGDHFRADRKAMLEQALRLWPEELESRSLLMHQLYIEGCTSDIEAVRRDRFESVLAHGHIQQQLAPQSFKVPVLMARALIKLGREDEARQVLSKADRFAHNPEASELRHELGMENEKPQAAYSQ